LSCRAPIFSPAEPPFFVLPSASRASLSSFGTASPHHPVFSSVSEKSPCGRERVKGETPRFVRGDIPYPVLSRHTSLFVLPRHDSLFVLPRHDSLFVLPRCVNAEGPLASFGVTKKKGSG
jgi:hypothetical protein